MGHHEIVKKLIGRIGPVGETNEDNKRFENLLEMCKLVDGLLHDIRDVSQNKSRGEYSMKRAGNFADGFLNGFSIEI